MWNNSKDKLQARDFSSIHIHMDRAANDPGEIDLTLTEKLFFKHSLMYSVHTYSRKIGAECEENQDKIFRQNDNILSTLNMCKLFRIRS